jgi:uncharacterized protein (TIGR00369 family)
MSIWFAPFTIEQLHGTLEVGLAAHLGVEFTAAGDDWLAATMPVDARTHQPMGLLHGGASLALAETVGSCAANLCVDRQRVRCLGQEINGNHIRAVATGLVTATARPLHLGGRSHVWAVEIRDPAARLVCVSRLTLAVLANP